MPSSDFRQAIGQVFDDLYFRKEARKGVELLYDMQFDEAATLFSQLESHYPEHPAPYFLQGLNRWWESYVAPEMETYHTFILEKLDQAIEKNKGLRDKDQGALEYTFFQFMSYAFKSRLYILRKEWLKAANAGGRPFPTSKRAFNLKKTAQSSILVPAFTITMRMSTPEPTLSFSLL